MSMYRIIILSCLTCLTFTTQEVFPRDRTLSPEETTQLQQAQTVLVQTIALTEKGPTESQDIYHTVSERLEALGFTATNKPNTAHDVLVKIKCEERKTPTGPSQYGGDADSLYAPSPSWRGPACQITYGLGGHDVAWRMEVRTSFQHATRAARAAKVKDSGHYALTELTQILKQNDFPYLLATEWGQAHRLQKIMENPETPETRKLRIIPLLGQIAQPAALQVLEQALQDPNLASSAAVAIGHQGGKGTEVLLHTLHTATNTALKVSAVKGLGEIATHNSQAPVFTPLLVALAEPTTEIPVQTEIVKALGKLADQRAVEPLTELNQKAWTNPSRASDMQELREALSWSLWQLNPDAHAGE